MLWNHSRMFLFLFALTSLASAGNLPCMEPDTDHRLPSKCPLGQVLHSNVCRSYFQIRSQGKTCLLSENLFLAEHVPTDEVICPLKEQTSDCNLFRAIGASCFSFHPPAETQPPCKQYDAQGEYEKLKICPELTDGIPLTGFKYEGGITPTVLYPTIVVSLEGQCPIGYCPTNTGKCIRWWKRKFFSSSGGGGYGSGVFESSWRRPIVFKHGESANVTNVANFRAQLKNSQKVPQVAPGILLPL